MSEPKSAPKSFPPTRERAPLHLHRGAREAAERTIVAARDLHHQDPYAFVALGELLATGRRPSNARATLRAVRVRTTDLKARAMALAVDAIDAMRGPQLQAPIARKRRLDELAEPHRLLIRAITPLAGAVAIGEQLRRAIADDIADLTPDELAAARGAIEELMLAGDLGDEMSRMIARARELVRSIVDQREPAIAEAV